MRKFFTVFVGALFAGAAVLLLAPAGSSARSDKFRRSSHPIANRYIVVLNDEAPGAHGREIADRARELASEFRGNVDKVFESAVLGFSFEMDETEAIRLSNDARVQYIEEDGLVEPLEIQSNATWGISRIDQRNWQYPLSADYEYNATGAGVSVYVLDTGVLTTHPDFGGRAFNGANTSGDNTRIEDCNGHGTHVAGTIGSDTYGVAKGVHLYSVRVFPCWGGTPVSNVVAGLDWVSRNAALPAVANMSLGTSASSTLDQAVQAAINRGITVVAAAGNSNRDACGDSPARVPGVITVGMTDQRDYRDWVSNYGPCVDLFAPGIIIESLWNDGRYGYSMSGTSAAAPHAAGVAALFLSVNPGASPREVSDALVLNSTKDILTEIGQGSPNRFLYSGFTSAGGGAPACSGQNLSGSISSPGGKGYQSSSGGFSSGQGTINGKLNVPPGATFRLNLEKKQGKGFSLVASSAGGGNVESVQIRIRSGTYRWRIDSLLGTGEYSLCSVTP